MKMSSGFAMIAEACRGTAYGHVPGNQYHDVEVGIGRRGAVYRAAVLEIWGSAQGRDEEHGRRKVVARGASWREALDGALSQARDAGIGTEEPVSGYLVRAASACRDEAEEADEKSKAVYYYTEGSVRGDCGHKHRTLSGALRCLVADRDGCHSQGGYSDREVKRSDGEPVETDED